MKNLGRLIRFARESAGLTQKELSDGSCTSKYIYMIEKGERQPSVELLESLSEKTGMDLFEFLPYVSCENPIEIKKIIDEFNRCRHDYLFTELDSLNQTARLHSDFLEFPWNAEIKYNETLIEMYQNNNFVGAKESVTQFLRDINYPVPLGENQKLHIHPALIKLYNLLAISEMSLHNTAEGFESFRTLYNYTRKKENFRNYHSAAISVQLNYCYILGDIDREKQLKCADELLALQYRVNLLDRLYLTFFIKGAALYHLGHEEEAIAFFRKALCAGLSLNSGVVLDDLLHEKEIVELSKKGTFTVDLLTLI